MRQDSSVLGALLLGSSAAYAQSSIIGTVKDNTGGVLPGVVVEISSPVLIEKTKSAVTDAQGQFRVVDLRPGSYTILFTLPGFASVKHENFELPSDFIATLNAELKVGSVAETITVTGASPVVDVQTASRPQVLNRTELDALPSGRTIQAVGLLVVGVNLSAPDTGGTTALQQTYMSVHGATSGNVTVLVDGVNMTGMQGSVQAYWNEAMNQEVAYQTSAMSAEVAGGGVRVNMIPRDGGNQFNGTAFFNFSNSSLQGSNLSDELKAAGLTSTDKIDRIWDSNFSQGGRIVRDKLWFFGSVRSFGIWAPVAETFYADGTPGRQRRGSAELSRPVDVAGDAEEQVRRLLRSHLPLPRPLDGRRRRPGDGGDQVDHADDLRQHGEVDVDGDQPPALRARLLRDQHRVQDRPRQRRSRQGARHAGVVRDDAQDRHRSRQDLGRRHRRADRAVPQSRQLGAVVGHRRAQPQERRSVLVGRVSPRRRPERRSDPALSQRCADRRHRREHAARTARQHGCRSRPLRAGFVAPEPADAQPGPALRAAAELAAAPVLAGRTLQAGGDPPAEGRRRLEELVAAHRRRLRSLRQRRAPRSRDRSRNTTPASAPTSPTPTTRPSRPRPRR